MSKLLIAGRDYYPIPGPKEGYECIWVSRPEEVGEWYGRPVKAEPKWEIWYGDAPRGQNYKCITLELDASDNQAQLIKDCVEVLMRAIFGKYDLDSPVIAPNSKNRLEFAIALARQSMSLKGEE